MPISAEKSNEFLGMVDGVILVVDAFEGANAPDKVFFEKGP
jgi:predicted membrane GTPase involved in stress response